MLKKYLELVYFVFVFSALILNPVYGQDEEWINYTTANGLVNNSVSSIGILSDTLFIGTYGGGVNKFYDTTGINKFYDTTNIVWDTLNVDSGLVCNFVNVIVVDADTIWIGTDTAVSKLYGTVWDTVNMDSGLVSDSVLSITLNADTIWFGTDSGAVKFNGTAWDTLDTADALISNIVNAVTFFSDTIWLGTDSGVFTFDEVSWDTLDTSNGLGGLKVNEIAVDSNMNKWFGTDSGAYKYNGTAWDTLRFADGLINDYVNTISIDTAGIIWFGTDGGVSKYDGVSFTNYTTSSDGLVNNIVNAIAFDTLGNVWFGTDGGVSKLGKPLYGDVNFNGNIETTDATKVLQYKVGKTSLDANQRNRADVSGIGGVTSYDASLLLQKIALIITQFPVEMSKASALGDNSKAEIVVSKKSKSSNVVIYQIEADKINGVLSAGLEINYDCQSLEYIGCELSEYTKDFLVETEQKDDGVLYVAIAGSKNLNEKAELISLRFEKTGNNVIDINLVSAFLNETNVDAISNVNKNLPNKFEIYQNYPNPFNPETNIHYQIPKESKVVLKIYNILGQEVKTLVDEIKPAGFYSVKWNARNDFGRELASGIYFYRISAGDFNKTMKLILIK